MRNPAKFFVTAVVLMGSAYFAVPSSPAARQASGGSSTVSQDAPLPACPDAQEHSLPLPTSVPPGQFVDFEKQVLAFLQNGKYKDLKMVC
jgi:hypothetical protein